MCSVKEIGGEGVDVVSGTFVAGGYNWELHMMTTKNEDGNMYICLRLCVKTMPSHSKVQAKYKLIIFNRKPSKHIKVSGVSGFMTAACEGEFHYMIPLETFLGASSGFLTNDSCIIGVETLNVLETSEFRVVFQCASLSKGIPSHVLHTWNFGGFKKPHASVAFEAGGLKWHVLLHPIPGEEKRHLSIYLKLDYWDAIRLNCGIYVEFIFCMKDQIMGKHVKERTRCIFSSKAKKIGWPKFLLYEDLYNPSRGLVINNTCTFEISVTVVGSAKEKQDIICSKSGKPLLLLNSQHPSVSPNKL